MEELYRRIYFPFVTTICDCYCEEILAFLSKNVPKVGEGPITWFEQHHGAGDTWHCWLKDGECRKDYFILWLLWICTILGWASLDSFTEDLPLLLMWHLSYASLSSAGFIQYQVHVELHPGMRWISFRKHGPLSLYNLICLFCISSLFKISVTQVFRHPIHLSWSHTTILCFHDQNISCTVNMGV